MAGLKRISYTEKDHEDIVNDCIERIKTYYGSEYWNDFEEDNAGVMLVEAFAYITDLLLFYLDKQANETFLPTATERQNLINMCKIIRRNILAFYLFNQFIKKVTRACVITTKFTEFN